MKVWLNSVLFFALTTMPLSAALAADVGYEVEIIIFEDTTGLYEFSEQWPVLQDVTDIADASPEPNPSRRDNRKNTGKSQQYQLLKPEKYRLNSQAEKLIKHPDYRVLIHTAWKQVGLDKDQAFAIQLDSRLPMANKDVKASAGNANANAENSAFVEGEITLIMSRYLHIVADLHYRKPINDASTEVPRSLTFTNQGSLESAPPQYDTFPISYERRMRSREIHYLDHPMVGMIVVATPYKIGSESAPGKPSGYQTL